VSNLTERAAAIAFNEPMLSAIIISLVIVAALGYALRSRRTGDLIVRRPYNNRYSDAAGAREDHLG
jgi:hypothetical protein